MVVSSNEACRGMNRERLKAVLSSLGPLIYATCVIHPGPMTPRIYEAV